MVVVALLHALAADLWVMVAAMEVPEELEQTDILLVPIQKILALAVLAVIQGPAALALAAVLQVATEAAGAPEAEAAAITILYTLTTQVQAQAAAALGF